MSQERTEQRDPVADMTLVEAVEERAADIRHRIEHNPRLKNTFGATIVTNRMLGELEVASALRYWIELAERRREERDSNQRLHIQSLEEIDRLNAVITGQAEAIKEQTAKVQERDKQVAELKQEIERWRFCYKDTPERLAEKDQKIREVGRLAMERREEIERLKNALDNPRQNLLFELHNERTKKEETMRERDWNRKEIERLRAALEEAESDINELLVNSESPTFIEQYAPQAKAEIRAALKGAE